MIIQLTFDEIFNIWSTKLWTHRVSPIESHSAMCYKGGYNDYNKTTIPTFFGFSCNKQIIAVNSGHLCNDNHYRSRGLWVDDRYRKQGIGTLLLLYTIQQGINEHATLIWSYPRQTSQKTYEAAGFTITSPWEKSETSDSNAYCELLVTNHHKSIIATRITSHLNSMYAMK